MAIKKKKKRGVREPINAPRYQLAENLGGEALVFLSLAYSYLLSPGLDFHGFVGRISGRTVNRTGVRALWLYFCLSAFIFKEEFRGSGPFAGLWTASDFFTSCSLSTYKCLVLSVAHMLAIHDQSKHALSPRDEYSLVTSLYESV